MSPRVAAALLLFAFACSGSHGGADAGPGPEAQGGPDAGAAPAGGTGTLDGGAGDAGPGVAAAGSDAGSAGPGATDAGAGAVDAGPGGAGATADAGTSGDGGTTRADGGDGGGPTVSVPPPAACPPSFDPMPADAAPPPTLIDPAAGQALAPVWEIRPAAARTLSFTGIVDEAGNVYWTEATPASGPDELVSATRDGSIRFRAPGPNGPLARAGSLLVSIATVGSGCQQLEAPVAVAYSTSTGAEVWRRDLLPAVAGWMRAPGSCRYGAVSGLAVGATQLLVALSILDRDTLEHESGYLALDGATGDVAWTARTSPEGNVMESGPPRLAEDGAGYGSRTVDYRQDELLSFPAGQPPRTLAAPPAPWHGSAVAASGALLVTQATGGSSWSGPPQGLEIRCRADGEQRAPAGSVAGQPLLAGGAAWFFGDQLAAYDAASGALRWRVALGAPSPPPSGARAPRPVLFRSPPLLTAASTVLFTEQRGTTGDLSSQQVLEAPSLREVDGDGHEILRRTLPLEPEAYDGRVALDRGRLFLGGQVLPSAGAAGVVRAFDLPGHDAARAGWIVPEGSLDRDQRAR